MSSPILVGYERSESAERALDRAILLAHERHATLMVLAVHDAPVDPTGPRAFGTMGDGSPMVGPFPELPDLHVLLDEARVRVVRGGVKNAKYVWAIGEPGALIVETARDNKAQVIVVGQGHHGFLGRAFGADVAAEVEKHAGIPVEIVD